MRKKKSSLRKVKSINISLTPNVTVEIIENIPMLKNMVYEELYTAVKEANEQLQDNTILFELNDSGYTMELGNSKWVPALQKAISYYEKSEEYEKCALYKTLINQIDERNKQSDPSNKQHTKRRGPGKKKKQENASSKK